MVNRMNKGSGYNNSPKCAKESKSFSGTMEKSNNKGKNALLQELQTIDFAIIETVLYLDAYPNCKKALAYYNKLIQKKDELCEALKAMGVAITSMSNTASTWTWTDSPWPWELEANL